MELEVNRVYINDVPEHKDIIRRKKIFVENIDDFEESVVNKKYTTIKLTNGEEFTIAESYDEFEKRINEGRKAPVPGFRK